MSTNRRTENTVVIDDRMRADTAYRLACEGTTLLWRGDFHNGRQLLAAMARRTVRKPLRTGPTPADTFWLYRRAQAHRALVLGRLLVRLEEDYSLVLRRAPEVHQACVDVYGPPRGPSMVPFRELQGVLGARQWREKGVAVPALGARIHPHYGVFSPVRGEYVDLVARAPLPTVRTAFNAFDLGTGTGVLAAVLVGRGAEQVVATDIGPRALVCARDNLDRLGLGDRVRVVGPTLYPEGGVSGLDPVLLPEGRVGLVVCNPPWIPARPSSDLELGVYDADGGMLHGFLTGLADRLEPGGEGWLVLSDLAEHLGLRTRNELLNAVGAAGLRVVDRVDTRPSHPRARDRADPLHAARAAEVTSLWRLAVA